MKKEVCDVSYPDSIPEGVRLEKNVYVTMRDGVRIALDIYKPAKGKEAMACDFCLLAIPERALF